MDNAHLLNHLRKKSNLKEACFIIGGGPSKNTIIPDNSVLDNKNVIGTNNAYTIFPNALVTHFADESWYKWHIPELHEEFKNPITTCTVRQGRYAFSGKVNVFKKEIKKGLPETTEILTGNNAGHQAISLAYNIGFREIVLIGFDMNEVDSKTHWHNGHRKRHITSIYKQTMIPGLKRLAEDLKTTDVKVFNANPNSAIKCFPFKDIKEFL